MRKVWWWIKGHISAIAFATGFVVDTLTLKRIDLLYENFVFISYLLIACIGIFLVHAVETRLFAPKLLLRARPFLPVLVQFPLGGLLSGFLIFYTKSASLFTSWPFVLLLFTLFAGNEFFRKRYEKLVFQISFFYFALISYLVLVTPIVLHTIGTSTFVFAGILSLFIISVILQVFKKFFGKLYQQGARLVWACIALVYVGFNVLYFTNIIPPVPLAIKEIGVFHSVVRVENGYRVRYERPAWYESWRETSGVYHRAPGEAAYCFSSVFAPTYLRTQVYHSWQRKTADGTWVRESRIPFTIEGGRDGGYRGYTLKQNISEGTWRCVVETENMQVIGQTNFNVIDVAENQDVVDEVR
jgi:hypothetical protein